MESSSVAQTPRGVWGSVCGWLGESLREHRPWPVLQLPIDERGRGNTDTDLRRDATPQQHQRGPPHSAPLNSSSWRMCKRRRAGSSSALPTPTTMTS
ncbi:uncharacterized protein LOC123500172 isoform X2 [Portunus trituberculatus]|uniref:uncharacterized protein LOC123500172 isoform X2 n=1 Tax=Portunus trituberculatus TaxID=210409 RepID=UPI001E1CEFB9|nr:uncharacterized protein LOC123500172 isoform X2 [Portunus trituberculatus]